VIKINPGDETSHAMLASLAFNRKDCDAAVSEFAKSQSLMATQVNALEQYASCLARLRRITEAIPIVQRLAELQPNDEKARYNLAVTQSLAGRYQDVITTLQPLTGENAKDPDALDLLAEAHEAVGETPQAVAALRRVIVTKPDAPKYYVDFANICLAHDAFQVGIDMLDAGLKRIPGSAPLYLARGILYIQLGRYDKSEGDFAEAERSDPNVQFGSAAQGLAELQRNDLGEAEKTVRARLLKKPNDAFLHYLLAETLTRRGAAVGSASFKEAVSSAERAVQLQPNFALGRDVLGRLYLQEGRVDDAIKQSRLAFDEDPTDQTALYHLIVALRKGNKAAEIPRLAKKLAELRERARAKEQAEHKYTLVEVKPEQHIAIDRK
jgi:tetratricopeptide (TPR) repeat protein